jgi:WD40 repeat protein
MKSLILIFALTSFLILQVSLSESYQSTQPGKVGLNEVSLLRYIEAEDGIKAMDISNDGSCLAIGGRGFIRIYSTNGDEWVYKFNERVDSLSISSTGELLAVGTEEAMIYLFHKSSSKPILRYNAEGPVLSISFSDDGKYFYAGTFGGTFYLFEASTLNLIWKFKAEGNVAILALSTSFNGNRAAAGVSDNSIIIFSKASSSPLWKGKTEGYIRSIAMSSDGTLTIAGGNDSSIYFIDLGCEVSIKKYMASSSVRAVALSSSGSQAVAGSEDGSIYFFERFNPSWVFNAEDTVSSVAISSDGKYLCAGSFNKKLYFFFSAINSPLFIYPVKHPISHVAISSNGDKIAISAGRMAYLLKAELTKAKENHQTPIYVWAVMEGFILAALSLIWLRIRFKKAGQSMKLLYLST